MTWAIETFGLTKQFYKPRGWREWLTADGRSITAVAGVSLAVAQGELFGLLGPNGAGKTTLVKLLSTLILPTSGQARLNGFPLNQESAIKRSIGLATSDERSFYWRLSGRQNLEFFAALHGLPPGQTPDRVQALLEQVGLAEVAENRFQTYSTGMRQRLTIARALLHQPRLLFLDEPTKGLDPGAMQQFHALIQSLSSKAGLTIFLTTHYLEEAEKLCDRVAIMDRGQIRACGSMAELSKQLDLEESYRLRVDRLHPVVQAQLQEKVPGVRIDLPQEQAASGTNRETAVVEFKSQARELLNEAIDILRAGQAKILEVSHHPVELETIFRQFVDQGEKPVEQVTGLSSAGKLKKTADQPNSQKKRKAEQTVGQEAIFSGAGKWLRIGLAFLKKDLQTETSYRFSFFLQLWGVFFAVLVFYFIADLFGEAAAPYLAPYGGDYFSFVLIGIAFQGYFSVGLSSFANSLRQAQTTGTLEAMLTTPTGLSTIILSSAQWEFVMTTLRVAVYLAVGAIFLGVDLGEANYPAAALILLLTVITFSSLGIIAASFIMVVKRGDPVTWFFSSASSLLGGVYFPITILPEPVRVFSQLLPITYALNGMRLALLQGASLPELLPDSLALVIFSALLLPASLLAFRYAVRRAKREGSLTHY